MNLIIKANVQVYIWSVCLKHQESIQMSKNCLKELIAKKKKKKHFSNKAQDWSNFKKHKITIKPDLCMN